VEKHPEIVPVHPKFYTYFVLVTLVKKNSLQKIAVPLIEAIQDLPNKLASVIRDQKV
jgi:hypothetical protein